MAGLPHQEEGQQEAGGGARLHWNGNYVFSFLNSAAVSIVHHVL